MFRADVNACKVLQTRQCVERVLIISVDDSNMDFEETKGRPS